MSPGWQNTVIKGGGERKADFHSNTPQKVTHVGLNQQSASTTIKGFNQISPRALKTAILIGA